MLAHTNEAIPSEVHYMGELAQILVPYLSFSKDGMIIDLRVSKTDQEGAGRKVGIPFAKAPETCPV